MIYALTTFDNPYDPVDDFENWLIWDNDMGYGTMSRLARELHITDSMSEDEKDEARKLAIDRIVLNDPTNIFVRIVRDENESQVKVSSSSQDTGEGGLKPTTP